MASKSDISFKKLQERTLKQITEYAFGVDLHDAEPKQLISMAKSLTSLVKRSRKAVSDKEVWHQILSSSMGALTDILEQLQATPDVPLSLTAQVLGALTTLNELAEKEATIEQQEEFKPSEEDFEQLLKIVAGGEKLQ